VTWHNGHYSQVILHPRDDHVVSGEGHLSPVCNLCSRVWTLEQHVRLNLPIIIVVWCDSDLGMISLKQIDEFGKKAFRI
jgi:thiamine pyrophosphate-dependent acetolactate synthase large subunit-like protein